AAASAGGLLFIGTGEIIPSAVRNPIASFVDPGVSLWWFVLGGPFQSSPRSGGGIAFAAIANAILWLLPLWLLVAVIRRLRRVSKVSPS
ncbi:MAG: hypothetical protein ACREMY_25015, partial [bacterium]